MRRTAFGPRFPYLVGSSDAVPGPRGLAFLRDGNRTRNGLPLLRVHRIRKRQVKSLRLDAILRMLVAKHVRRPILRNNSARKSCHHHRRSHEGAVRKFLMISNGSHTSNAYFAVMKHPVVHDRNCGHRNGVGRCSNELNSGRPSIASTKSLAIPWFSTKSRPAKRLLDPHFFVRLKRRLAPFDWYATDLPPYE